MTTPFLQVADNAKTLAPANAVNNTTNPLVLSGINTVSFPAVANGYIITIWDDTLYSDPADDPNMEKATVTAATIATNGSLTLQRTAAKAHAGTPRIALLALARHISDLDTAVNSVESSLAAKQDTIVSGTVIPFTPTGNVAATNIQAAIAEVDAEKLAKAGDTLGGRLDFLSTPYDINNPAMRFTQVDSSSTDAHAKGLMLEWGGNMSTGVNYPYGIATNAYQANNNATFTVPSTGYKKWGWIMTHYQSPISTGETVHQHLNFETVKADWNTVITRLQISFGEDVALISFPNSIIRFYADKLITIGNDATNVTLNYNSSSTRLEIGGTADIEIPRNVKIGAAGGAAAKLHVEATTDTVAETIRNTTVAGNNTPLLNMETQTSTSRLLQGGLQADANKRISILANGQIDWGDGTATRDTNLYRKAAAQLITDGSMIISSKLSLGQTTLDTAKVLSVVADGTIPAIQARASALGTASTAVLSVEAPTGQPTKRAIDFRLTNDSVSRLRVDASNTGGTITFGDGTSADTNLYRSAVDTLKTDDNLIIGLPGTIAGSAATIDAAQTITNKTISGASNTLSNIPESAVTNLTADLAAKQATLVSGTNLKTVNGNTLLGSGDITITGGGTTSDATTTAKGVIQLAGDLAGTAAAPTLANTIGTSGTTGSSGTVIPVITYDAKGRITALSSAAVATPSTISGNISESQVTNLTTDLAAKQAALSLTTTGTSGPATLSGATLNIPNYATGGGVSVSTANTWTAAQTFNAGTLLDKGTQVYNVRAYGAVGDGATDDTAAIQSALDAAATAGGGIVFIPKGNYVVSNLTIDSFVTLEGGSKGAVLLAKAASTGFMISLKTPASTQQTVLRDFTLKPNTGTLGGVKLDNTGFGTAIDPLHVIENLVVLNAGGDAFYFDNSMRELQVRGCYVHYAGGRGFYIGAGTTDSRFIGNTTGPTTGHGYEIVGNNNNLVGCKAFYAGFNGTTWNATSSGFKLNGTSYTTLNSCSAQQNALHGFTIESCSRCSIVACESDTNSAGTTTGVGFNTYWTTYSSVAHCTGSNNGILSPGAQKYGLQVDGTQTGTVFIGNTVTGTNGAFGYVSGFGYMLIDATIADFSGIPTKINDVTQFALAGATSGTTAVTPAATASGTWTLPSATDTFMGRATTDTVTNKTISGASNTLSNIPESAVTNLTADLAAKSPALIPTAVKTSAYTLAANDFVPVDTTAGAVTLTLPAAPANGTRFGAKLILQGGTNTVTITRGGTDVFNKTGGNTSVTLTLLNQAVQYQYFNGIWYGVASDIGLTALDARYAPISVSSTSSSKAFAIAMSVAL